VVNRAVLAVDPASSEFATSGLGECARLLLR